VTSAAAILSLALAIGACTSAFRLIDALLLRPLPVADPGRLYGLSRQVNGRDPYYGWEFPVFRGLRASVKEQAELIAISYAERVDLTYGSDQEMERTHVQYVSGWMFGSLGIRPALGRLFTENDDREPGAHPYAVLSHDYWVRRFVRDPQVIGRAYRMGNRLYTIVGVAAPGFTGTEPGTVVDIFMPSMMHWGVTHADWSVFRAFLRPRPGVAIASLRARLAATLRAVNIERVKGQPKRRVDDILRQALLIDPAAAGVSGMQKDFRVSLTALSILVGLVLLIACANVANLMTAQAASRAREMALRVSIGAGPGRLVQLVLVEGTLLAVCAAAIGAVFAWWSAPFVAARINPPDNPIQLSLPADWRVVGFGFALTLGVTLLFGLAPALRASAVQPASVLKGGDRPHSRRRLMHFLVGVQAAFCFLVLLVAGLFVATFDRLSNQPTGFSAERLLTLDAVTATDQPQEFWDQVAERLRAVPGVETVAISDWPLMDGWGFRSNSISIAGALPTGEGAWFKDISPGWIGAMRIPFLDGRDFRENDTTPGVAIVNQAFARQYFDGANPIGKWFEGTEGYMKGFRFQIVGLVADARYRYLRQPILPVAYTPFHRSHADGRGQAIDRGTFVVRTSGPNPIALASTLRREVARARPGFRVSNVRTQLSLKESQTVRERLLAMLALFFAVVALLLAGVGLYGVLDYSVLQRRREIGIRLAIGAQAGSIARVVTVQVFSMVLVGALAGLVLGVASVRYIEALLYQVRATDWGILALPSVTILAAAVVAAVPAVMRAVRIDPVTMLRAE
jgi:predicted permease